MKTTFLNLYNCPFTDELVNKRNIIYAEQDLFLVSKVLAIVLEEVDGGTLTTYMDQFRPLLKARVNLGIQVKSVFSLNL